MIFLKSCISLILVFIEGIYGLRDESVREGMWIVIELKLDAKQEVVKNNLFKQTQLVTSFGVNMLALVSKQPRLLYLLNSKV